MRPPDGIMIKDLLPGADCNCPLDCEETVYNQEISQASFINKGPIMSTLASGDNYIRKLRQEQQNATKHDDWKLSNSIEIKLAEIFQTISVAHFYFKEPGIVQYSREELFGVMDLVGNYSFTRGSFF